MIANVGRQQGPLACPCGLGRARWAWLFAACALALGACEQTPKARDASSLQPLREGDPDAPPSLSALPDLVPGGDADTPRMHDGMLLARAAFDAVLPDAPVDRSFGSLQRWVEREVSAWVERRRGQVDATRACFERGGAPSEGESVVRHAVLGLLEEDTARWLGRIPPPRELDDEPEIASMYVEMVRAQTRPFLDLSVSELGDCANEGYRASSELRPFALFCHARFDRLQRELEALTRSAPLGPTAGVSPPRSRAQ